MKGQQCGQTVRGVWQHTQGVCARVHVFTYTRIFGCPLVCLLFWVNKCCVPTLCRAQDTKGSRLQTTSWSLWFKGANRCQMASYRLPLMLRRTNRELRAARARKSSVRWVCTHKFWKTLEDLTSVLRAFEICLNWRSDKIRFSFRGSLCCKAAGSRGEWKWQAGGSSWRVVQ